MLERPRKQLLPPPLADDGCRQACLAQVALVQVPLRLLLLHHRAGRRCLKARASQAVAAAEGLFEEAPHGVNISTGNGLHPGKTAATKGLPELLVAEALLLLRRPLVSHLPADEAARFAFAEGPLLQGMGAQAAEPINKDRPAQASLHLL